MSVMPSDVDIEVKLLLKNLVTALVWALPVVPDVLRVHVPHTMLLQLSRRFELLLAFRAQEGKLSCVVVKVSFQTSFGCVASLTIGLVALERLFPLVYLEVRL